MALLISHKFWIWWLCNSRYALYKRALQGLVQKGQKGRKGPWRWLTRTLSCCLKSCRLISVLHVKRISVNGSSAYTHLGRSIFWRFLLGLCLTFPWCVFSHNVGWLSWSRIATLRIGKIYMPLSQNATYFPKGTEKRRERERDNDTLFEHALRWRRNQGMNGRHQYAWHDSLFTQPICCHRTGWPYSSVRPPARLDIHSKSFRKNPRLLVDHGSSPRHLMTVIYLHL